MTNKGCGHIPHKVLDTYVSLLCIMSPCIVFLAKRMHDNCVYMPEMVKARICSVDCAEVFAEIDRAVSSASNIRNNVAYKSTTASS